MSPPNLEEKSNKKCIARNVRRDAFVRLFVYFRSSPLPFILSHLLLFPALLDNVLIESFMWKSRWNYFNLAEKRINSGEVECFHKEM